MTSAPGPNQWAKPVSVRVSAVATLEDGATIEIETVDLDLSRVNELGSVTKLVHGVDYPYADTRLHRRACAPVNPGPAYVTLEFAAPAVDPFQDELYRLTWKPKAEPAWTEGDVVLGDYTYVREGLSATVRWQAYDKGNPVGRRFRDEHMDYLLRTRDELRVVRRGGQYQ